MDSKTQAALQQQFEEELIKKNPEQWADGTFFAKTDEGHYTYHMTDTLWYHFQKDNPRPTYTDPKQVIVVRRDLEMPAGKLAAQVAHASMAPVLNLGRWHDDTCFGKQFLIEVGDNDQKMQDVHYWMTHAFAKVVLEVYSEAEMEALWAAVSATTLPQAKIVDHGRTTFKQETLTCVGIGPGNRPAIDELTGHLKLYGTAKLKDDGYYYGRKKVS